MQGISSWMLGSREEALKLAPAWGARKGGLGAGLREGSVEEEERDNEGGRLVEGEGMLGGRGEGREGGDSTHLLRRFSAQSLGCGKLNV